MERIEDVSEDTAGGNKVMICRLLAKECCNDCIITKWFNDNKLTNMLREQVLRKLEIEKREDESQCYVLYKYIYKKEIEKKVRVWKELKM
jgi:hypothetical protein